jgi:hypothetical protein
VNTIVLIDITITPSTSRVRRWGNGYKFAPLNA